MILLGTVVILRGFKPNEVSSAVLRAQWSKPGVWLLLDENLLLLFWWKQWLHWRGRKACTQYVLFILCLLLLECVWHVWLQRSTTGPFWPQRSDCLSHAQDDPEPADYIGLEVPQKQTSVCATVNSFTTRSTLLWKLNLCSQIDGVRGINREHLQKLKTCLTMHLWNSAFRSVACCYAGWWCGIFDVKAQRCAAAYLRADVTVTRQLFNVWQGLNKMHCKGAWGT